LKKYTIVLSYLLLTLLSQTCFAQNETDNWYFGNRAGLNFSTCTPTILTNGQVNTLEGVATISDINGNLLFYTDGITVWNKQHLIMQNGTGLFGNSSSAQSAVIVPKPGNPNIYFIFTTDDIYSSFNRGLNYSIVDITLNGGLGAVTNKNIFLFADVRERLAAIKHQNNTDFWIVTRALESTNYYSWQITSSGVTAIPVISATNNFFPYNGAEGLAIGCLRASSDGKFLFCGLFGNKLSELGNFSDSTGQVTNAFKFSNNVINSTRLGITGSYGAEFSPNNKYLYVSSGYDANTGTNTYLTQYDLSNFDSTSIANSRVFIDSGYSATNPNIGNFWALQLAKNGKIYIAQEDEQSLSVINNPNNLGAACNFVLNGQSLGFRVSKLGLPTFIQSYFNPNYRVYDFSYTEDCQLNVSFSINTTYTYDSLRWFFGDAASGINNTSINPTQVHSYNTVGTRTVKLYVYNTYGCVNKIDSVVKEIPVGNQWYSFGPDKLLCQGDSVQLNATTVNANTYAWSTGANTPTIKIFGAGIYWCDVTKGLCTYRDSIVITTKPLPIVNLGADKTLCEDEKLILNAFNAGATYTWQDNSNAQNFTVSNTGQYFVRVDLNGCVTKDTINISYNLKPRFSLGTDKSLCPGLSILLDPKITNVNYSWQDGTNTPTFLVQNTGLYYLTATNNCGSKTDSINVINGNCTVYFPNAFTPNSDNKNDIFKALFVDDVGAFELQIFNRYGQIIFKTNSKTSGWDGKFNGITQPQGVYVWIAKYTTISKAETKELRGTISLVR
jgi:gliding motility-associated-like protein